jgi:hypothetical protein
MRAKKVDFCLHQEPADPHEIALFPQSMETSPTKPLLFLVSGYERRKGTHGEHDLDG